MNYQFIIENKANVQLLQMLEYDFDNYSNEALEYARKELKARDLSQDQISKMRLEIEQTPKIQKFQEQIKAKIEETDLKYKSELGTEDSRFWYLFMSLLGLIVIVSLFSFFRNQLSYGVSIELIISIVQIVLSLFILQRCYQKRRIGWIVLFYYAVFAVSLGIVNMALSFSFYLESKASSIVFQLFGNPLWELAISASSFIFHFLLIWLQSKNNIKNMYAISNVEYNKHVKYAIILFVLIILVYTVILPLIFR